ncbi:hypothetical protein RND81_02G045300 [Saponaria officinalis]|uniref:Pentatricopeptide repeat-containing protein n=1 Tax=Saponaria officinalis TaxID=3572 RepID=A0AAW1MR94_SAPOF
MQVSSILSFQGTVLQLPQIGFQLNSASFDCTSREIIRKRNLGFRVSTNYFVQNTIRVYNRRLFVSLRGRLINGNLDSGLEEPFTNVSDLGELHLSENVGSNADKESIDDVDNVVDETLEDNLRSSENVTRDGSELEGEKTPRVDVLALSRKLQLAKSLDDVEWVLKDEGMLPLQVFSSMIRIFGREKRLDPAMAVVAWLKKKHNENDEFDAPNLFIYNSLLGAVKKSRGFDKVEMIMNDISEAGFSPSVVTYNTLMGIYLDDDRASEALKLFDDMQQNGLPLSPASYSMAMLTYRKMEDGNGALRLYVGMREKFMNGELKNCDNEDWETEFSKFKDFASRVCYQVMRTWLVKDGNLTTDVLKLLIEMDKVGISPTNLEYERLIWACTREEHYTVAKELYNRIRERRSGISLSACNHLIWLMGKAKKWWAALEVFENLLEFGPKPNSMSYELIVAHFNVLLSAARKRGIWRWGIQLLEKMEAKGLKPRSREWNAVLVACAKAAETSAAVEIFKKMVERGEKPTEVSYGALLSALEKGKMYDEAIRVWEHMRKVGIEPNQYSYTIMASVYVGLENFNLVENIIKEMVSTGIDPTVVTFNAIISVCSRNGLGGEAYEWFQRMKAMNIDPNEITYEMLIYGLANDGKPRLAYDAYLRAVNEGLTLSYRAYDAVIQSSQDYGATIDVTALGPRPLGQTKNGITRNDFAEPGNDDETPRRRKPVNKREIHAEQPTDG